MKRTITVAILGAVFASAAVHASAQSSTSVAKSTKTNVELILDASGSMYSRLPDGGTRIGAAKDVLSSFISQLPDSPDLSVGIRVYGAKTAASEAGACKDSVLSVPLTALDRAALQKVVTETRPKGATPIAFSLERAAADFPRDASRKLVVLVTDGIESCKGDLKAAFSRFKEAGFEIDLRIIGIDLDKKAEAAFAGIGRFENTRSIGELVAALGRATAEVAAPSTQKIPVNITLTNAGKPFTGKGKVVFTSALDPTDKTEFTARAGTYFAQLLPGVYSAVVETAETGTQTFSGLTVTAGAQIQFTFDVAKVAPVKLEIPPGQAVAGAQIKVAFSGAPPGDRNWITVVPKSDPDRNYLDYQYVSTPSGSVDLRLPDEEIELEVRYHLAAADGTTKVVGRSVAFTPKRVAAGLTAPDQATAGAEIEVRWTGPNNQGDYITVVKAGAPVGSYLSYAYTRSGNPVKLTMPVEPGAYELRYSNENTTPNPTRASRPIAIVGASYALSAPDVVGWGSKVEVKWTGPNNRGEYITIVKAGTPDGKYGEYVYTRDGNPVKLTVPAEAGAFEFRYMTEAVSPNPVLARRPVKITGGTYSVTAPSSAVAGSVIEVRFSGSASTREYITVVKKGAPVGTYGEYVYTRDGNPARLKMPTEPGPYEIRYLTEAVSPAPTLATTPITITAK